MTAQSGLAPSALQMTGLTKHFGRTEALSEVSFDLRRGEVHALVGGNGSGKSTLIKVLSGVHRADAGELSIGDAAWDLADHTPERARLCGLRFVHQDLAIFLDMTLAENLSLGRGFEGAKGRIRWSEVYRRAEQVLSQFGIHGDPRRPASSLSVPQRAMLAIARALQDRDDGDTTVLVLDEPTAALAAHEVDLLLNLLRELATRGHSIVIVSHRLDEIRAVADRVTGLRDGRVSGTLPARDVTDHDLAELILGRRLTNAARPIEAPVGETLLEVNDLQGGPLKGVDLTVRRGEILGIAGRLGSGRTELLEQILGVRPADAGAIVLAGARIESCTVAQRIRAGIGMVPEDRQAAAIFGSSSVRENLSVGHTRCYFRRGLLDLKRERRETAEDLVRYGVKASSTESLIETLSGGNQQKVVLARWLRQSIQLLLLDEPTQGVDIGARAEIHALIENLAASGSAVVVVSSEFEELARLCHRVVVLSDGKVVAERRQPLDGHDLLAATLQQRPAA